MRNWWSSVPNTPESRRRITLNDNGPWLVEGPVEVTGTDGTTVASDRFTVAICTCRRSHIYPWCDTSHRRRTGRGATDPSSDGRRLDEPHAEARRQADPVASHELSERDDELCGGIGQSAEERGHGCAERGC
ncbi:CDGSH iron-sulfur domain-containing protein [Streptomyces sp. NPDC002917]|uniref:CDGSH iron-sulfur domain-containing protein n=1 Tax=Streptomyces sp. NPDC002917 TaxID=3364671 RepID=UPI0036BD34C9